MIGLVVETGKPNEFAYVDWETDEIVYDEGSPRKLLTTSDVIFTHGKFADSLLSEVSESWYLKFMMEKNQKDHFISIMLGRRLKELQ